MAHTDSTSVLAKAIKDKISTVSGSLGIAEVLYGNHTMVPKSPTVVVMTGTKRRTLAGVSFPGGRTENELSVFIDVHSAAVGDEENERIALEELANNVEAELHKDVTMGGIIIHGFVAEQDHGNSTLSGEFRTVRLTYIGKTRTYLSPSP